MFFKDTTGLQRFQIGEVAFKDAEGNWQGIGAIQ